jgi:hypothetical protein
MRIRGTLKCSYCCFFEGSTVGSRCRRRQARLPRLPESYLWQPRLFESYFESNPGVQKLRRVYRKVSRIFRVSQPLGRLQRAQRHGGLFDARHEYFLYAVLLFIRWSRKFLYVFIYSILLYTSTSSFIYEELLGDFQGYRTDSLAFKRVMHAVPVIIDTIDTIKACTSVEIEARGCLQAHIN